MKDRNGKSLHVGAVVKIHRGKEIAISFLGELKK